MENPQTPYCWTNKRNQSSALTTNLAHATIALRRPHNNQLKRTSFQTAVKAIKSGCSQTRTTATTTPLTILDLLMEQPVIPKSIQPRQTLREQHNLEPVDATVVVKHRYQFTPTTCNRNTFKVFFDKQYHETPVMTLLEEWLGLSTFPFLATPQKLIRLHNVKFGSEAVVKHITTKWKGVSSKFPHLTSV